MAFDLAAKKVLCEATMPCLFEHVPQRALCPAEDITNTPEQPAELNAGPATRGWSFPSRQGAWQVTALLASFVLPVKAYRMPMPAVMGRDFRKVPNRPRSSLLQTVAHDRRNISKVPVFGL